MKFSELKHQENSGFILFHYTVLRQKRGVVFWVFFRTCEALVACLTAWHWHFRCLMWSGIRSLPIPNTCSPGQTDGISHRRHFKTLKRDFAENIYLFTDPNTVPHNAKTRPHWHLVSKQNRHGLWEHIVHITVFLEAACDILKWSQHLACILRVLHGRPQWKHMVPIDMGLCMTENRHCTGK